MEVALKGKAKRRHINAEACAELGRCAEGTDVLTQPHTVNHNPNRGLLPRTFTKRWKCAGIVEEKENNTDSDSDDVSLIADVTFLDAETTGVVDDAKMLVCSSKMKEEESDHLEGITAEMFGDDHFDSYQNGIQGEHEEVDAIPDAHYGLLGTSSVLLLPQGSMDDLPEEVLIQVLSFLPAQDLYRNIRLVCHRWKNIVEDTKFVPFKKQYYRYLMNEKYTVEEVSSILLSSDITNPVLVQNSIRNLVVMMAHHRVGERVLAVDVLECVKKHRLYPQAEASIRLRIPNVYECMTPETKDPNPYAAMAVILILSESVVDVEALVSLLTDCMSYTTITEYLSHIAMMLLAIKRNNIQISNRVHYNIYYVLHLMENGPFSVSSGQSRHPQIRLSHEQQLILSHDIKKNHVVKIIAFAGTGKTTTLVKYAENWPHLRFLYVAFNKSVAEEARQRFPNNVHCRTVHSLAYKDIGRRYHENNKLVLNVTPFAISMVLPKGFGGFVRAKLVASTLKNFMASSDKIISSNHVPNTYMSHSGAVTSIHDDEKLVFVQETQKIWTKIVNVREKSKLAYCITHDGYLKLWQLQNPKPCLSDQYDALFIDEAQDCTPAIMDVLLSQNCGKILVGDPHQQIYTFKGAVNALQITDHTHIYYLTQSFRFGAEISYVGATLLDVCKNVDKILVGGRQKGGVCDEAGDQVLEDLKVAHTQCPGKTAILSRCNLGVFSEAVRLTDVNSNCRIHFIGGADYIGLNKILDIWQLMKGRKDQFNSINNSLIRSFARTKENPYLALKSYATQTEDRDLEAKLAIVEKYSGRIPQLVQRLKMCSEANMDKADFIIGTVHKSKGLEFHTVVVTDDFIKIPSSRHNVICNPRVFFSDIPKDEWNLLYVAVTRATTSLIITSNIRRIITIAGEYYLKSEMPQKPLKVGETPPCSVVSCPNFITPGSAFIMSRRQMRCTDAVSKSGPLCERCVWARIGPTAFLMTDDVHSMAGIPIRLDVQGPDAMFPVIF